MAQIHEQVAKDVKAILKKYPDYDDGHIGPILVRLAWHASGTYSNQDGSGGSEGATMRFHVESYDSANDGLHVAKAMLEPIKAKYGDQISYSDLWTLAAVVAIADMGGPCVKWRCGRIDAKAEPVKPIAGRLPDASQGAQHVRDVFYRMGFNDREIVALSGAHSLGRCHANRSGFVGPWTHSPTRFSNQYFKLLLNEKWIPVHKGHTGPLQYQNGEDGELMMLPTDMALVSDPKFKVYVDKYAADKELFFKDFSAAFEKLLELGFKNPKAVVNVCPMARSNM